MTTTMTEIGRFRIGGHDVRIQRSTYRHERFNTASVTILADVEVNLTAGDPERTYFNGAGQNARGALLNLCSTMTAVATTAAHFEFRKDPDWALAGEGQAPGLHALALDLQKAAWSLGDLLAGDDEANHPDFPRVAQAA